MSIELVAIASPEPQIPENLPAEPGSASSPRCEQLAPGGYCCLISRVGNELTVWDLGTEGGTLVNGVRVTKATLHPSD